MDTATEDLMVSAALLAEDFRLSDVELGRLARKGIIPRIAHPTERRSYLFPLHQCIRAYVEHLKSEELLVHQRLMSSLEGVASIQNTKELAVAALCTLIN